MNVYTYREQKLIQPLFDAFTKDTGIKVNVVSASSGLEQRIKTEGTNSPADVLLTVDIGRLGRRRRRRHHPADQVGRARQGCSVAISATRKATGTASRCARAWSMPRRIA